MNRGAVMSVNLEGRQATSQLLLTFWRHKLSLALVGSRPVPRQLPRRQIGKLLDPFPEPVWVVVYFEALLKNMFVLPAWGKLCCNW